MAAPFELSGENAAGYLRDRGIGASGKPLQCRELGGGVSNTVVLVESGQERFILKQALPQLRVKDEWLADRTRIWRERDSLAAVAGVLPPSWVPKILWSDESNFLFAMEAAPEPAEFWKSHLLAGQLDAEHAKRAGIALGLTIRATWKSAEYADRFGDQTAFDQLRIDPYYRTIARRNPDIAAEATEWIAEMNQTRVALTHGDWSPKNMMVTPRGLFFIDYECAHFGDPAFDAAFCINHLILKSFHQPQHAAGYLGLAYIFYTQVVGMLPPEAFSYFERATVRHLGLLMLARVDGKSPVEYITREDVRDRIRAAAKRVIECQCEKLNHCFSLVSDVTSRLR
jgi:5-methylthioribose kinase